MSLCDSKKTDCLTQRFYVKFILKKYTALIAVCELPKEAISRKQDLLRIFYTYAFQNFPDTNVLSQLIRLG